MLMDYNGVSPALGKRCFIAETAAVIGNVTLGDDVSVWYGAAVRGDALPITVGARSNIQDNATIHTNDENPVVIGCDVSIGHNAVVHGAVLEDGVLVGIGAVVMDGAVIGAGSLVAAGALVTKNTVIPPNSLAVGVPARVLRSVEPGSNLDNAEIYVRRKEAYLRAAEAGREEK